MVLKKRRMYTCKECGQIYHHPPPKKCIKISLFTGDCNSTKIERIKRKNVIDMHDVMDMFIKKLVKGDYDNQLKEM